MPGYLGYHATFWIPENLELPGLKTFKDLFRGVSLVSLNALTNPGL